MVQPSYPVPDPVRNKAASHDRDPVDDVLPYQVLALGQSELMDHLPDPGSMVLLDEALAIVGRHHCNPYAQIIVLMNRGLLTAEFEDGPHIDPELVLRRV